VKGSLGKCAVTLPTVVGDVLPGRRYPDGKPRCSGVPSGGGGCRGLKSELEKQRRVWIVATKKVVKKKLPSRDKIGDNLC
jgi:hypothetical protein